MEIKVGTPIILYQLVVKNNGVLQEIIRVSDEYYWYGNGNVGYFIKGKPHIVMNVNEVSHITHVVPFGLKNHNYGKWVEKSYCGKKFDTNFFIDGYEWEDFEKSKIVTI